MANTYRAFISYSHTDAAAARRLHARLETYRLPAGVRQASPAADGKGKLGPIFLDREELPASSDLSASVRAALAASDVLVVLCSPDARASRWVNREIELFREVAPDRPILAAIVRGEPDGAFPEQLLDGREPLAADLRQQGDGRRLGFLKIVAGIADVPLDALVQRDAQRNLRRVTAVTLATTLVALAMAIMTVIAIQSRNEADDQRGEAVALAKYMSTDLRDKLRGVGRLDLMADVVTRALAYCESQGDMSDLPEDSLEGCAQSLHAKIEIETTRERPDLAVAAGDAAEAYRMTTALIKADPRNANLVFDHAQSQYWTGRVAELGGDYAQAERHYLDYRASTRALARLEPSEVRTLMELGYSENNLGMIALDGPEPDPVAAAGYFEAAIDRFRQAVAREPENTAYRAALGNAWAWLANARFDVRKYAEAMPAWEEAERIRRAIAEADPADFGARYDLLLSRRALAVTNLRLGNRDAARAVLEPLVGETAALSMRDPTNGGWRELADKVSAEFRALK